MGIDDTSNNQRAINAEALIEAFGGIRPMAQKLDIAVSTVQGWKARNHIPPSRLEEILLVAASEGIDIDTLAPPNDIDEKTIILDDKSDEGSKTTMQKDDSDKKPTLPPASPTSETIIETKGGSSVAWLALILTIALGAAILTRPAWAPVVYPKLAPYMEKYMPMAQHHTAMGGNHMQHDEMVEQHTDAMARIAVLESALAKLSTKDDAVPVNNDSTTNSSLNALDGRIVLLEDSGAALDAKISEALKLIENTPTPESIPDNKSPEIETFANQLTQLSDTQLALQEKLTNAVNADSSALADMAAVMNGLAQLTSTLENKISELDAKITQAASSSANGPGQQAAALVVSISQLESQVLAGKTYSIALQSVNALVENHATLQGDIENLGVYAQEGIVSKLELNRRFSALAPDAQSAYRKANAHDWVDETLENIKGLISVRRIGDDQDLPPVSRAEAALGRDDLIAAIAAMSEISGSAVVSSWIEDAKAHLLVETALYNLRKQAINLLVQVSAGASE